jgi:hypothetical protein
MIEHRDGVQPQTILVYTAACAANIAVKFSRRTSFV